MKLNKVCSRSVGDTHDHQAMTVGTINHSTYLSPLVRFFLLSLIVAVHFSHVVAGAPEAAAAKGALPGDLSSVSLASPVDLKRFL